MGRYAFMAYADSNGPDQPVPRRLMKAFACRLFEYLIDVHQKALISFAG